MNKKCEKCSVREKLREFVQFHDEPPEEDYCWRTLNPREKREWIKEIHYD